MSSAAMASPAAEASAADARATCWSSSGSRRPGEGDDVPVAVPARGARIARLPDRRRRRRRLVVDDLRERARTSIEGTGEQIDPAVFDRFAERLSYVSVTSRTRLRTSGSARRSRA
jgi:Glucose-6-phosphate 1-dehydrogenase